MIALSAQTYYRVNRLSDRRANRTKPTTANAFATGSTRQTKYAKDATYSSLGLFGTNRPGTKIPAAKRRKYRAKPNAIPAAVVVARRSCLFSRSVAAPATTIGPIIRPMVAEMYPAFSITNPRLGLFSKMRYKMNEHGNNATAMRPRDRRSWPGWFLRFAMLGFVGTRCLVTTRQCIPIWIDSFCYWAITKFRARSSPVSAWRISCDHTPVSVAWVTMRIGSPSITWRKYSS